MHYFIFILFILLQQSNIALAERGSIKIIKPNCAKRFYPLIPAQRKMPAAVYQCTHLIVRKNIAAPLDLC